MTRCVDYDEITPSYDARYSMGSYQEVLALMRSLALAARPEGSGRCSKKSARQSLTRKQAQFPSCLPFRTGPLAHELENSPRLMQGTNDSLTFNKA